MTIPQVSELLSSFGVLMSCTRTSRLFPRIVFFAPHLDIGPFLAEPVTIFTFLCTCRTHLLHGATLAWPQRSRLGWATSGHKRIALTPELSKFYAIHVFLTKCRHLIQIIVTNNSELGIYVRRIWRWRCRIWGFHSGGYEEYHILGYDAV
jgi:hypothetical protein